MTDQFILSNFDTHIFLGTYTSSSAVATTGTEIENVINFQPGEINKDTKTYRTLTNDGWESIAVLGQSIGDVNISCIRPSDGQYTGSADAGTTNYEVLRAWFDGSLGASSGAAPKKLIVVTPRDNAGSRVYEGMQYNVIPKTFSDGDKDPDAGQEFSVTLAAFGAPTPCSVTKSAGGAFSFAAIAP